MLPASASFELPLFAGAAEAYLQVFLVADDVQSAVLGDPKHVLGSPALWWSFWGKEHPGTLRTLKQTAMSLAASTPRAPAEKGDRTALAPADT